MAKIPTIIPVSDLRQDAAGIVEGIARFERADVYYATRPGGGRLD